jgi:hypothetical protein
MIKKLTISGLLMALSLLLARIGVIAFKGFPWMRLEELISLFQRLGW